MNKYLRGVLNCIIMLGIGYAGLLFSCIISIAGYIFFPHLVMYVSQVMVTNPVWWSFVPATIPCAFIFIALGFSLFVLFRTIILIKNFDIENIINYFRNSLKSKTVK